MTPCTDARSSPRRDRRKGFSLVEVTIAMGIFGSSVLVLLGLTAMTADFATTNRELTLASQIAGRVFADLAQPQHEVAPTDHLRVLHPEGGTSPYGTKIAPGVEHYGKTPLAWLFSDSLTALPVPAGMETALYESGSSDADGRFIVALTFANEDRFERAINPAASVAPAVVPPVGASVLKRVLVSVELPANVARENRRKYEFYRVMEFR